MIIERQQTKIAFSQIRTYAQRDIFMPKIITFLAFSNLNPPPEFLFRWPEMAKFCI